MLQKRCANDNHGRAVVTVRFCSSCGVVVNNNIRTGRCLTEHHARLRRAQSAYCVDCGERLIQLR
jgi:hypothetical protein